MSLSHARALTPQVPVRLAMAPTTRARTGPGDDADLTALVREWIALTMLSEARGRLVASPSERMFHFVTDRLSERAELAIEAQDSLTQGFTLWEIQWVERSWHGLSDHPSSRGEVERYLRRAAARYRRHPDFDVAWRQPPVS